jgi:hypothetical protein
MMWISFALLVLSVPFGVYQVLWWCSYYRSRGVLVERVVPNAQHGRENLRARRRHLALRGVQGHHAVVHADLEVGVLGQTICGDVGGWDSELRGLACVTFIFCFVLFSIIQVLGAQTMDRQ